jgi:hypothetical protein
MLYVLPPAIHVPSGFKATFLKTRQPNALASAGLLEAKPVLQQDPASA